jgi:hypothetical protein
MSNIVNKVKDALTGHKDHDTTTGTTNTSSSNPNYYGSESTNTSGPHSSNAANKLDPRVDSDRDGSYTVGNTYGSNTGSGMAGMTGPTGTHSGGHGPHSSGMANKADPFVDSTSGTTTHSGGMGSSGYSGSANTGPHSSNVANKLDPRVDTDRDGSYTSGNIYGSNTGTGMTGSTGYGSTGYGSSEYDNKSTAGPHKSDLANKLDPRVDSDYDGSRTVGGQPKYGNQ